MCSGPDSDMWPYLLTSPNHSKSHHQSITVFPSADFFLLLQFCESHFGNSLRRDFVICQGYLNFLTVLCVWMFAYMYICVHAHFFWYLKRPEEGV